jgi:hypothetical protein
MPLLSLHDQEDDMRGIAQTVEELDDLYQRCDEHPGIYYGELVKTDVVKVSLVEDEPPEQKGVEVFEVTGLFSGLTLATYPMFYATAGSRTRKYLQGLLRAKDGRKGGQFLCHRAILAIEHGTPLPDGRCVHGHHIKHNPGDLRDSSNVLSWARVHTTYHQRFSCRGRGSDLFKFKDLQDLEPGLVGWLVVDWRAGDRRLAQNMRKYWASRLMKSIDTLGKDRANWLAEILMVLGDSPDYSAKLEAITAKKNVSIQSRSAVAKGLRLLVSRGFIAHTRHGHYALNT